MIEQKMASLRNHGCEPAPIKASVNYNEHQFHCFGRRNGCQRHCIQRVEQGNWKSH